MNNNVISKFNGQYLKCIVTKHKGTMNALSDKGALIIYQKDKRNYAYLGNEFIASGYGFDELEKLNIIEKIIDSYDSDIETINNSLKYIQNNINNINSNIDETLTNKFNAYDPKIYVNNGEHIVSYNLNDIFFRGQNAIYKNIEFSSIKKKLLINNVSEYYYDEESKSYKDNYIIVDDIIELPIGTKINKIIYEFDYNKNDTGGFKNLYINYFKSCEDSKAYYNTENPQLNKISQLKYSETQINAPSLSGTFTITFDFDKNPFYITGSDEIIVIDSISGDILGTMETQYKYYPRLNDFDIYSIENIIDDHYHIFDDKLRVKPISFLRYRFNEFNINENGEFMDSESSLSELDLSYICDDIMISPTDTNGKNIAYYRKFQNITEDKDIQSIINIYKTIKGNIFYVNIPIENMNSNVFTFFIPYSFKIHKVLYVTENSEYNLTGCVGYIENLESSNILNENLNIYIKGPLLDPKSDDKFYYIKSRIYQFTINKGHFNKTGFFKVELLCINENFENDLDINDIDTSDEYNVRYNLGKRTLSGYKSNKAFSSEEGNDYRIGKCKKWIMLNDEEFNRIYWLSLNDVPEEHYKAINEIKSKLNFVNERIIE